MRQQAAGEEKIPDQLARAVAVDLQQIPELIFQIANARQSRRGKKTAERGIHGDDLHVKSLLLKPNPLALSPATTEGGLPVVQRFMQGSYQNLNAPTLILFLAEFIHYYELWHFLESELRGGVSAHNVPKIVTLTTNSQGHRIKQQISDCRPLILH